MTLPRRAEAPPSGVPSWARVGQKVVCISVPLGALVYERYSALPEKGAVYTIRDIQPTARGNCGLLLSELHNPASYFSDAGTVEPGYGTQHFRPLITKSQDEDIAEFRKLLTGQPVRENERA